MSDGDRQELEARWDVYEARNIARDPEFQRRALAAQIATVEFWFVILAAAPIAGALIHPATWLRWLGAFGVVFLVAWRGWEMRSAIRNVRSLTEGLRAALRASDP